MKIARHARDIRDLLRFWNPTGPGLWEMALKGQKINLLEKSPKWSKIIKNGLGHKNSAFWPRVGWYMPRWVTMSGFWENRDLWYFGPILAKWLYIYFLGVPGHLFTENAFMERDPRGIQKPTWEPPTLWGTRVMAARSFNFNEKPKGIAISRDFWHFFNFDVFFEGVTQGHQKTQAGPSN